MTLNGKRELVIPSKLGFGATGYLDVVPPNSTLYYDIQVVGITPKKEVEKENLKLQKQKMELRKKKLQKLKQVQDVMEIEK